MARGCGGRLGDVEGATHEDGTGCLLRRWRVDSATRVVFDQEMDLEEKGLGGGAPAIKEEARAAK